MQTVPAAVIGASGYSGLELTRLLARHPRVRLTALTSDRWAGEAAGARLPLPPEVAALTYGPLAGSEAVDAEVAFLATPAEVSHDLAPRLLARGLQGGRPLRRLPPRRRRRLPGLVRLRPPAPGAAGRGPLRPARAGPRRAGRGPAGHQPRLLRHRHRPGGGPAGEERPLLGRRASPSPASPASAAPAARPARTTASARWTRTCAPTASAGTSTSPRSSRPWPATPAPAAASPSRRC